MVQRTSPGGCSFEQDAARNGQRAVCDVLDMKSPTPKLLLDYAAAADALCLSRAALRDLVYKGRGPRVTKIGRRTFFAPEDLQDYVDKLRVGAIA